MPGTLERIRGEMDVKPAPKGLTLTLRLTAYDNGMIEVDAVPINAAPAASHDRAGPAVRREPARPAEAGRQNYPEQPYGRCPVAASRPRAQVRPRHHLASSRDCNGSQLGRDQRRTRDRARLSPAMTSHTSAKACRDFRGGGPAELPMSNVMEIRCATRLAR